MYCPHQPLCTGCSLSSLTQAQQLEHKEDRLRTELGALPVTRLLAPTPILGSALLEGYRLRAKLVYQEGRLGLFTSEHNVVDTRHCRIVHPRLQSVLNGLRDLLPLTCELLAVDARLADEGVLLTLVVPRHTPRAEVERAAHRVMGLLPDVKGVAYSERAETSPQVLGGTPVPVAGVAELRHTLTPGRPHHLAVFGGFVQAHAQQTAALHDEITATLRQRFGKLDGLRVVELFSGAGALALHLSSLGARVVAVDAYAPSVALLERTAREQGLALTTAANTAENSLALLAGSDVLIVDPPRRGLSVEVRRALAAAAPRLLVYVSCDPRTLARDLSHLAWLGYGAASLRPIDMIPVSDAVETFVTLEPAPRPALEVIHRDATLVAVNKPPHLPTTPHAEYADNLLELVKALPGCEQAAPVHRLDVGTSGVCLFAVHPSHAQRLGAELTEGQKTYVALAQGITNKRGTIRKALLEGRVPRAAETRYVRTGVVGTHSLVTAHPTQGRKHQIRRHFAAVGHPLLGDSNYAKRGSWRFFFDRHGLDRPFLHCAEISLVHGDIPLTLRAPLAPDLERVLLSLEQKASGDGWRDD